MCECVAIIHLFYKIYGKFIIEDRLKSDVHSVWFNIENFHLTRVSNENNAVLEVKGPHFS